MNADAVSAHPDSVGRCADVTSLFTAHYLSLVRLAAHLVDDLGTAEDVVQDVFAALQSSGNRPDDPLHYLRVAVVNRSRSVLRRRRTVRLFGILPGPPEDHLDRADAVVHHEPADAAPLRAAERTRLLTAVRRLPTRQREVVVLRYYEQLSVAEVAGLLGIAPGAVSSSLGRALTTLSRLLEEGR